MRNLSLRMVVCVILLGVAGCCTSRHCENAGKTVAKYQFHITSVQEAIEAPGENAESAIHVLILSGGGSHGAWGAGVLRGWRENAQNPRPKKFQVVTGVSTGALLATYAFLGDPLDDELLERAYTTTKTAQIYRKKFLPLALFSDSLYSSAPLKKTIRKYLSQDTLERVARTARQEHRRLYVGTINHDTGRLVIWDLTEIALDESNPKRIELYRKVVLASASIPILTPPVEIDGNLYADGGAQAQLFFEKRLLPALRNMRSHPDLTLHVIVNGKLGLDEACTSACLKALTTRTLDMLLDANAFGDLYHIKYVLKLVGFGHFRLCYIPSDFPVTTSDVFEPEMMRKLYQAGFEFGKTKRKWDDGIPDMDFEEALRGLARPAP